MRRIASDLPEFLNQRLASSLAAPLFDDRGSRSVHGVSTRHVERDPLERAGHERLGPIRHPEDVDGVGVAELEGVLVPGVAVVLVDAGAAELFRGGLSARGYRPAVQRLV